LNIYFHIDELNRDSVVASAVKDMAKKFGWRVVFGNRQLGDFLPRFEKYFDIVVLPKPTFFTSFFNLDEIQNLKAKYVMLYTEQIGIMTSKNFPRLALRQMLDKEFMSGDSRCVDKVAAFCFWSNQARNIVTQYFPQLESKCHVVGHPRHDVLANPILYRSNFSENKEIGILTRAVLLNDYFGRNPLENIFEHSKNIKRGGVIEYHNDQTGDYFISQIRGTNPKNDVFLEALDFENMMLLIEELLTRGFNLNLKLHPKENSSLYHKLYSDADRRIKIAPQNTPFAHWVQSQKFLIGPPSTSFYDSYLLGILPISTSELNPIRKDFVPEMYEDNNQLMNLVFKPKSVTELVDFIENVSELEYQEMVCNPEISGVLSDEVNFPNQGKSLQRFLQVVESLLIDVKPSIRKNFGVYRFMLFANVTSEIKFPYLYFKGKFFGLELLNSASFIMNFHSRWKIRRLISQLRKEK
jgi:surface carbohydrate biosynthesis protein